MGDHMFFSWDDILPDFGAFSSPTIDQRPKQQIMMLNDISHDSVLFSNFWVELPTWKYLPSLSSPS